MLRLLDKNHAPSIPKSYTFPQGHTVAWESRVKTFTQFSLAVQGFASANGLPVPSTEEIEDQICQRLPKGWCTSLTRFDRPTAPVGATVRATRKPCKSCGRR